MPGSELEPLEIDAGCNPIGDPGDCLLPWPSNFFRVESEGGGYALTYPEAGLPVSADGESIDFTRLHMSDGFPRAPQILLSLGDPIDAEGLPDYEDPEGGLGADSPVLLLDAATGAAQGVMAELDPRADTPERQVLIVRPLERLEDGKRYVVAVRRLIASGEGRVIDAPEGFRRLRDQETQADPILGELAQEYETSIFGPIEQHGWSRDELQLAWDFTVASRESTTADMLRARELVLAEISDGVQVAINSVTEAPREGIARQLEGTVQVPLVVEDELPGALLARDAEGRVRLNGVAEVPFLITVPDSLDQASESSRILQVGHGFFGRRSEVLGDAMVEIANETQSVMAAVDWWGMSNPDQVFVLDDLLSRPSELFRFGDRVHQGMMNQLVFAAALRGPLAQEAMAQDPQSGITPWDPARVHFFGNSLGQILGGVFAALDPELERVGFTVGGANFSTIMYRARPFEQFLEYIEQLVPDPFEQQKYASLSQSSFDRFDPIVYAPWVVEAPLPGSAEREVLIHAGTGDTSVPSQAAELHARALGIGSSEESGRPSWGLESLPLPHEGSAFVLHDFGLPDPLPATPAPEGTSVHGDVRSLPGVATQLAAFWDGEAVTASCAGSCDPD